MSTILNSRIAEIAARIKFKREMESSLSWAEKSTPPESPESPITSEESSNGFNSSDLSTNPSVDLFSLEKISPKQIIYNSTQKEFIDIAGSGNSCVLIGAAGTGKTTAQNGLVQSLMDSGRAGVLEHSGHKYLKAGAPGIVICAYTRRAVRNIRKRMPIELQNNCLTIHKVLEYTREFKETIDPATGLMKSIPVFLPSRNALNPLPESIRCIIFEESSMISVQFYKEITEALAHQVQAIFLGDIEQLPPVMGKAILGYKLWEHPVYELTEVYRQALESPIIKLAHRILSGVGVKKSEAALMSGNGLTIKHWNKKLYPETALSQAASFLCKSWDDGSFNTETDVVLTAQNVGFGTVELNKYLANHIARARGEITYEIIAGYLKHYLSVGDKVLLNKEDATVVKILPNPTYYGVLPQKESIHLNYWGVLTKKEEHEPDLLKLDDDDFNWEALNLPAIEEKTNQASHRIQLRLEDTEALVWIDKSAEVNYLDMAYAMTVHKAQGSEWDKVFFITHHSQQRMMFRELLYTAVTRAKKELFILAESDTLEKGITTQRIKGQGWKAKAEAFKGKLD